MKTRLWVLAVAGVMALTGRIEAQVVQGQSTTEENTYLDWDDPRWWGYISTHQEAEPAFHGAGVQVGKSDYKVSGPFVETFKVYHDRSWSDLSVLEKMESIPILNLFVPQPMPIASRQGIKYFKWGESDQPWVNIADHGMPGPSVSLFAISH
jgi:hypothetical protein